MQLNDLRNKIEEIEARLADEVYVHLSTWERDGHGLRVALTDELRRSAKRGRVWKSRAFLTALQNAAYGFDERRSRSRGGSDGLFALDRDFQPPNAMMRKLFDRYIDSPRSRARAVADRLGVALEELVAVRLVSHQLRPLGVLRRGADCDELVLVDYDDTK